MRQFCWHHQLAWFASKNSRACFSCIPLVPRFDVITGILSLSFMPGSNGNSAHMVPFPHSTAHLPKTRLLQCTAEDTNTPRPALTEQGQGGHCCSEGIVVLTAIWKQAVNPAAPWSILQATAASMHVPKMLNFKRCLSTNTSLMSVLYFPVLSLLKSHMAFRKPAGYFLLTSVGFELCPCWVVLQWQPLEEQWQNSF